jgi:hypothetical protein
MTLTELIKDRIKARVTTVLTGESVTIVDGTQTAEISLPTVAVEVVSSEAHSVTMAKVLRVGVEVTLRTHPGDTSSATWTDKLETALNNPANITALTNASVKIDHWLYAGSDQSFDESVVETRFSGECLAYLL